MSTGLQYLRSRYYSPGITRFMSKDPVLGVASLPYTFNPYLYCLNNAINYIDPDGRFFKEIFGTVAGAAKGAWNAGKAIFDDSTTVKEGWQSGWQDGKAAGNWRGGLWDSTITHNLDAQRELAKQTGQAPLPYASSTGGVQKQAVYPQVVWSPAEQITSHVSSYEEHEKELEDLEETLASYDRQIAAAGTQEEKMRLKEVQRRVEEQRKALCEEMNRDRRYMAAGVNEIISSVAPIVPGAGSLIGIAVKFVNAGIYGSLGEEEKALIAGVSGGLDTVNLAAASIAFGQMYKNALTDAEITAGNSAVIRGGSDSLNGLPQNKGYSSFNALKKDIGSPGPGKQWHHIVEQSQIKKSGFTAEQINNTSNIIAIDSATHAKISGYYNTKSFDFTNGLSVRDWLAGKSYEYQYNFGLDVLRQYGVIE